MVAVGSVGDAAFTESACFLARLLAKGGPVRCAVTCAATCVGQLEAAAQALTWDVIGPNHTASTMCTVSSGMACLLLPCTDSCDSLRCAQPLAQSGLMLRKLSRVKLALSSQHMQGVWLHARHSVMACGSCRPCRMHVMALSGCGSPASWPMRQPRTKLRLSASRHQMICREPFGCALCRPPAGPDTPQGNLPTRC